MLLTERIALGGVLGGRCLHPAGRHVIGALSPRYTDLVLTNLGIYDTLAPFEPPLRASSNRSTPVVGTLRCQLSASHGHITVILPDGL